MALGILDVLAQGGGVGVQVERELELVERFLVQPPSQQPPAGTRMFFRGAQARTLEGFPVMRVVGIALERLGVLEHGLVVVLPPLGLLAGAERGGCRAPHEDHGEDDERAPHPETTSTPFGTSNRNCRSSTPTFSLKRSKANWLRFPCASTTAIPRMRAEESTSRSTWSISGSASRGTSRRRRISAPGAFSSVTAKWVRISPRPESSRAGMPRESAWERTITWRSAGT